ncbi:hypothetical protein [Granulicella paludicola]|uniref:hypothetical protein n=1 Tax=Granulicella paludicola TaxID=474951 RepID=UPI0021E09993|nr:hypothetical protein [Granulicella paludicola]
MASVYSQVTAFIHLPVNYAGSCIIANAAIFREPTAAEAELDRLRAHLAALRLTLTARELALGDLRDQLASFEGRYLRQVGTLYRQLDEWEEKLAELHVKHYPAPPAPYFPEPGSLEPTSSAPVLDLKALFRELAKRIHPDFAIDAHDAYRRTRLMAQANDAYLREDAAVLQRMLNGFDPITGHTSAEAIEAELARTAELIQQVRHDIATAESDLEAAARSDSALLQQRCIDAALQGRDLLAEMAARVHGQIGITMARYERDLDRINRPTSEVQMESLLSAATPTYRRFGKQK